jgi:galactokinase
MGGVGMVLEGSALEAAVIAELGAQFEARFGRPPEVGARAPGRVNLIGEHTDYNEGLVLPCAIDRRTLALLARREDGRARVFSRERGELGCFESAAPQPRGDWLDYVQGVVFALRERGIEPGGFDLALASDVPEGSGLSSSAALELAVATALDASQGLGLDATERARLAHRAENGFAGVACGIMDQFASALGRRDHALRLDCRSQSVEAVPLPAAGVALLVADSGAKRALASAGGGGTAGYGDRVAECRRALAAAREAGAAPPQARALRDLSPVDLPVLARVLEPLLLRRARHVLTENERVDATCTALRAGDWETAGGLLRAGMRSLRDDFEVSTPELDALCALADALPGVYGSRLTGAGFGGCTLHLVEPGAAPELAEALAAGFERRFGRRPAVWVVVASGGAESLTLP